MRKTTIIVMAATLLVWVVYDSFMASNDVAGDTFSEVLYDWTGVRVSCALLVGGLSFLAGHILFPLKRVCPKCKEIK